MQEKIFPDFFIVGAAKSGTTSLYNYLKQHPDIYMSPIKETHFFSSDIDPKKFRKDYNKQLNTNIDSFLDSDMSKDIFHAFITEEDKYLKLFRFAKNKKAVGEVTNSYLYSTKAADNIYNKNPNAKIIIILRNPVDRAFSHYLMDLKIGYETKPFHEAFIADMNKEKKGWGVSNLYYEIGLYYEQVKRYLERFNRNQILIINYDDYVKNQKEVLIEICRFLEVNNSFNFDFSKKHNKASLPRNKALSIILKQKNLVKKIAGILPENLRKNMKELFYSSANLPKITEKERSELMNLYKDDIKKLSSLVNMNFENWLHV